MKRNLDIIREILLFCEQKNPNRVYTDELADLLDVDFDTVSYHLQLLDDCGYIEADTTPAPNTMMPNFIINRMTSWGHDYLDTVRDDDVYKETKKKLGSKFASMTLDVVKSVATDVIKGQLGI